MSALPVAITVAMIRPPQPSHGSIRFKMSTTKWCHTRVPKNGVSRSKRLLKPQPLPHQHWGLELRTSLYEFSTVGCVDVHDIVGVVNSCRVARGRFISVVFSTERVTVVG
jgi:hypothetical protein